MEVACVQASNDSVFALSSIGFPKDEGPVHAEAAPPIPDSLDCRTLTVDETTNLYGSVSFKMAGNSITPYAW